MTQGGGLRRVLVVVHPSPDRYGADLQMLESISAMIERGWRVVVVLPFDGPLTSRIVEAGGEIAYSDYPVLRKGSLNLEGLVHLLATAAVSLPRSVRLLRRIDPGLVLINTITLPWWVLASRLARLRTVVHLHEAETGSHRLLRKLLVAPLWLAHRIIVISRSAFDALVEAQPGLALRSELIYNGVTQPAQEPRLAPPTRPTRLAVIGRLSPRKGTDVALRTALRLRQLGHDVTLEVVGTAFAGYDWYEDELRSLAADPELAGAVSFSGYVNPIWPVLSRAQIVLAPSLHEPFGNVVVEAQMACRPVVAAAAQGHLESVDDGRTGLLVPAGDVEAMANAVVRLIADSELSHRIAQQGRAEARQRFSVTRYRAEMVDLLEQVSSSSS